MTAQLANTFNMPQIDKFIEQNEAMTEEFHQLEQLDEKIETITDLRESDKEMDDLAKTAMDTFDDLVTLGMDAELRHAAPILEVAAKMLGHAIMAKSAKIDRKLKAIDLEMKRQKMTQSQATETETGTITGDAKVLDRNDLLKLINNSR